MGYSGEAAALKANFAVAKSRARRGRAGSKKKARPRGDAPSNRTFGNCLLGDHSNQKDPAGTRANACFPAVAVRQQEKSSTSYPQVRTRLWAACRHRRFGCAAS